jgi:pimeloyl-ACP methyl ester carboxylesterase
MCYFAPERMPPERRRDAVVEAARRATLPWSDAAFAGSLRGLIGSYGGPGRRGLWSEAAAVAAPVLLVWGRHDRLVPVAVADRAVRTFPDARLVVFEDVGHVSQMEKPEETAAAVRRFLDDSRRR